MKKALTKAGALLLTMVLIATVFSGCGKLGRVKLKNYFHDELTFTGTNGYGSVEFGTDDQEVYDLIALFNEMRGKKADADIEEAESLFSGLAFLEYVDVEVEGDLGHLKNGDEVTVTVTAQPEALNEMEGVTKKLGKKDTTESKTYTVKGLKDPAKVNAFDAVKGVYCYPKSGTVYVEMKQDYSVSTPTGNLVPGNITGSICLKENDNAESPEFTVQIESELSNIPDYTKGKKVNLELSCDLEEYSKNGVIFTSKTQEFEVKELKKPGKSINIAKSSLDTIKKKTDEQIKKQSKDDNGVEHEATFVGFYYEYDETSGWYGDSEPTVGLTIVYQGIFNGRESYVIYKWPTLLLNENNEVVPSSTSYFNYNTEVDLSDYTNPQYGDTVITKIEYK